MVQHLKTRKKDGLKGQQKIQEKTDRVYQTEDTPLIKVRFAYKQSASAMFYYVNH